MASTLLRRHALEHRWTDAVPEDRTCGRRQLAGVRRESNSVIRRPVRPSFTIVSRSQTIPVPLIPPRHLAEAKQPGRAPGRRFSISDRTRPTVRRPLWRRVSFPIPGPPGAAPPFTRREGSRRANPQEGRLLTVCHRNGSRREADSATPRPRVPLPGSQSLRKRKRYGLERGADW